MCRTDHIGAAGSSQDLTGPPAGSATARCRAPQETWLAGVAGVDGQLWTAVVRRCSRLVISLPRGEAIPTGIALQDIEVAMEYRRLAVLLKAVLRTRGDENNILCVAFSFVVGD